MPAGVLMRDGGRRCTQSMDAAHGALARVDSSTLSLDRSRESIERDSIGRGRLHVMSVTMDGCLSMGTPLPLTLPHTHGPASHDVWRLP